MTRVEQIPGNMVIVYEKATEKFRILVRVSDTSKTQLKDCLMIGDKCIRVQSIDEGSLSIDDEKVFSCQVI